MKKCADCEHVDLCPAYRNGGECRGDEHQDDCDCTACQLRRLVEELLQEAKRLRHDLAEARTAMVKELARKR